jgi:hypothetical protein
MAETKPGTSPVRARIGNTGEEGRRQPAMCLSHHPRDEELPINHLGILAEGQCLTPDHTRPHSKVSLRVTGVRHSLRRDD